MQIKDGLKSEPIEVEKEPSTAAVDTSKMSSKRPKLILSIKQLYLLLLLNVIK